MPFDMSTLIFAALAIFFVWKLRSVLGQKTGSEERRVDPPRAPASTTDAKGGAAQDGSNVIRLPGAAGAGAPDPDMTPAKWNGIAEQGSKVAAGLDAITARDPAFSANSFIAGARAAYEMIVTAFAAGDRKTLKALLAADVYESFEHVIAEREARQEKMATTLVSIDKSALVEARLRASIAHISVRFLSKLINVTTNSAGQPINDQQGKVTDSVDVWTFSRDVVSRDPNWKLVATEADQSPPKSEQSPPKGASA